MGTKSPVFPIPQHPQHFSDYGFDPQMDYLQVLEEAKKHKRESSSRSIESLHFKLQKPISKDDSSKKKKWWKNAIHYCKKKWIQTDGGTTTTTPQLITNYYRGGGGGGGGGATISGPIYITESRSGSSTPCRISSSRPTSGPLSWTLTPNRSKRQAGGTTPYVCLQDHNMMDLDEEQEHENRRISTTAMPIYLVT